MIQHPPFRPGQTVLTADISRLGAVAEVRGPFLRVHRRFRGSFWLAAECILWADHDRVVMAFARADLNRYRRARLPAIPRAGAALVRIVRPNLSPYVRTDRVSGGSANLQVPANPVRHARFRRAGVRSGEEASSALSRAAQQRERYLTASHNPSISQP